MPGAQFTEIVDPQNFKGKIAVRLGPVALTFDGDVAFESIDDAITTPASRRKAATLKAAAPPTPRQCFESSRPQPVRRC
jgi:hypothetical protein